MSGLGRSVYNEDVMKSTVRWMRLAHDLASMQYHDLSKDDQNILAEIVKLAQEIASIVEEQKKEVPMITIQEIQTLCTSGRVGGRALRATMELFQDRSIWSVMVGQCKGHTDGRPVVVDTYSTNNWGTLQTYHESTAKVGDIIEHDGQSWQVIVNHSAQGDAHVPSKNWFVAVAIAT